MAGRTLPEWFSEFAQRPGVVAAMAIGNLIPVIGAVFIGIGVMWGWGTSSMFAPLIAIITAFAMLIFLRVALDPEMGPRAATLVKSRLGFADLKPLPKQPSQAPTRAPPCRTRRHLIIYANFGSTKKPSKTSTAICSKQSRQYLEWKRFLLKPFRMANLISAMKAIWTIGTRNYWEHWKVLIMLLPIALART